MKSNSYFSKLNTFTASLPLLLLGLISNTAMADCPSLKNATYTCSRDFSFFDDKVPWTPTQLKVENIHAKGPNSFSWTFGSEVGSWIPDGTIHQRNRFLDVELSEVRCLSDGKIEAVDLFRSRGTFDVRRDMTLIQKNEDVLRLTYVKDILIRGYSTNSDEEKWTCLRTLEAEVESLKTTNNKNLQNNTSQSSQKNQSKSKKSKNSQRPVHKGDSNEQKNNYLN